VSIYQLQLKGDRVPKRLWVVLAVLAAGFVLLGFLRIYVVRAGANGTLYWNASEALLFVEIPSSGARLSYVRYAVEPFLESLGDVRSPDNKQCSQVLVIRITDKNVQRFDTQLNRYAEYPYCFLHYVLFAGHIYTGYPAKGKIWKWSGTQFEPAAPQELNGFDPVKEAQRGYQFDDVDGWSMREYPLGRTTYHLTLNGQPLTLVSSGRTWPIGNVSVDLIRAGQTPERIWSLDERPHIVSKAEYEKIFGNP
jgi:hypothetical protein